VPFDFEQLATDGRPNVAIGAALGSPRGRHVVTAITRHTYAPGIRVDTPWVAPGDTPLRQVAGRIREVAELAAWDKAANITATADVTVTGAGALQQLRQELAARVAVAGVQIAAGAAHQLGGTSSWGGRRWSRAEAITLLSQLRVADQLAADPAFTEALDAFGERAATPSAARDETAHDQHEDGAIVYSAIAALSTWKSVQPDAYGAPRETPPGDPVRHVEPCTDPGRGPGARRSPRDGACCKRCPDCRSRLSIDPAGLTRLTVLCADCAERDQANGVPEWRDHGPVGGPQSERSPGARHRDQLNQIGRTALSPQPDPVSAAMYGRGTNGVQPQRWHAARHQAGTGDIGSAHAAAVDAYLRRTGQAQ